MAARSSNPSPRQAARRRRGRARPDHAQRRSRLWSALPGRAPAALLITHPPDVRYLTGFTGDDSFLLLKADRAALLTDGRYSEQAEAECPDIRRVVRTGKMSAAVAETLKSFGVRSLGFGPEHVTVSLRTALDEAIAPARSRAIADAVGPLRITKDESEVAAIRRAVSAAQKAMGALIAEGADGLVGRSESDVAGQLDYLMRQRGASGPSFETIVASGPHSARPHHRPGQRKIRQGEALLIDWGAKVDGYASDLTRVFFIRTIPPKLGEVYKIVRRAQQAGLAAVGPGVAASDVDAAARKVIAEAGYDEAFTHGLGHGLGLEIHEPPTVGRTSKHTLTPGMVITIEPGVYLPGVGGIRIEDDVLVTETGGRRLTSLPRRLDSMVLS